MWPFFHFSLSLVLYVVTIAYGLFYYSDTASDVYEIHDTKMILYILKGDKLCCYAIQVQ